MPTLNQIDKEGCFIHLGQFLPTSVRGNQAVPHGSTCTYSSSVRKTFHDICSSYGSFSRSLASPE